MAVIRIIQATGHSSKSGEYPLYVSFYLKKKKIQIPCKVSVSKENFDTEIGKVKTSDKKHRDKNLMINNIRSRVSNVMVKYRLKDKTLSKDLFMREYNRPADFDSFFDYVRHYWKRHPHEIEPTTLDVHMDVMSKLYVYKNGLQFEDISEDFLLEYKGYLKKKLNNQESTINKNFAVIKKYVRAAIREGYMSENPFDKIKISRKTNSTPEFLTEDELIKLVTIYNGGTLTEGMKSSLEIFLFMCFTSLHIGDARTVRIEQIGKTNLTYYRIKLRNSKPVPIIVPLSNPARTLIRKLKRGRSSGLLFTKLLPDQKINFYLKRISELAEIGKNLSCKAGRHTFATIFLYKTKDFSTLKEILGHSDLRETFIYAHILDQSKQEGIKVFNEIKI